MIEVYGEFNYEQKKILNSWFSELMEMFIDFRDDFLNGGSDLAEWIFPQLLYKENKEKCHEVIDKLYLYICDDYLHELTPFYQLALYGIISYFSDLANDDSLYFPKITEDLELGDGYFLSDFEENVTWLYDVFFYDFDFLGFPSFFESYKESYNSKKLRGYIDFEYYFEIMPNDMKEIWKKIKADTIDKLKVKDYIDILQDFYQHITTMINRFKHVISEKGAYKILWNDDCTPRGEEIAQIFLDNLIQEYCNVHNIDVSREVQTGRGLVDFKFSNGYKFRLLLEVKLASSSRLRQGLEYQLTQYLKSEQLTKAIYLVIVHDVLHFKKVERLNKDLLDICRNSNVDISLEIIDATRIKRSASQIYKL